MANSPTNIVICSCEDTMVLDEKAIAERLSRRQGDDGTSSLPVADRPLSGRLDRRRSADHRLHAGGSPVRRSGGRSGTHGPITYANIRESAGWSRDGRECRAEDGRASGSGG